ncbi:amidohydrolase family protein, partial [bacterium]|nr:amidohydrolase family protein [bacterium]
MNADLVLRGGRVFTAVGHRPFCSALAAQGGLVVACGEERDVASLVGPRTRVVELDGRLALPGFHDAHTHLLGAGLTQDELSLTGARSPEECSLRVRERALERARGEWIVGRGWDPDLFPGRAWPERSALDLAAPA